MLFERICRENDIVQRFTKVATHHHGQDRADPPDHATNPRGPSVALRFPEAQGPSTPGGPSTTRCVPTRSLDMATPASLFVPRPDTVADLILPPSSRCSLATNAW